MAVGGALESVAPGPSLFGIGRGRLSCLGLDRPFFRVP